MAQYGAFRLTMLCSHTACGAPALSIARRAPRTPHTDVEQRLVFVVLEERPLGVRRTPKAGLASRCGTEEGRTNNNMKAPAL